MITRITLNRFKKFKNNTVELRPFSVLTGENSCGKTTILQAVHLALGTLAGSDLLYEKNGRLQVKPKGVGATEFPGIPIEDFRELYYEKSTRQARTSNPEGVGAFLNLEDDRGNVYKLQISSLFGGFNIRCLSSEEDIAHDPDIYRYMPLLILGNRGIVRSEPRYFPAELRQKIASGNQGEVIRNQVLELRQNHLAAYRMLSECLTREFGLSLDRILFEEENDRNVQAMYRDCYGGGQLCLDYNSCGSGHLQILQILVPIYMLCPSRCRVVLLDEPEAHLHPGLQKRLLRTLQRLQRELNIQIILATQSQTIINRVEPGNVIPISAFRSVNGLLTQEKEAGSVMTRISNWDLSQAVISGKLIYMDEKQSDVWETMDQAAGTNVFGGIHIVPMYMGQSADDKTPFYMKALLTEFLGRDITICYVKDGGGLRNYQREEWMEYARQRGVKLHLLERYEIENYLLNSDLILRAMNAHWPELPKPNEVQIDQQIIASLKASMEHPDLGVDASLEDYMQYGSGKTALPILLEWIHSQWKMELHQEDLLDSLEYRDIPSEILALLVEMKSDCYTGGEQTIWGEEESEHRPEDLGEDVQAEKGNPSLTGGVQLTLPF